MAKNYSANDIRVLSDREHVRHRTAIYLGSTEETEYEVPIFINNKIEIKQKTFIPALYKSFNEILDNAIDELTQVKKKNKQISVIINNDEYTICDNGRGVPIDVHPQTGKYTPETVFTELRSGRNFDDDAKEAGVIGTNGVGSSCVAMLSETFKVKIKREKKLYEQEYKNGTEIIEKPKISKLNKSETGTCITYKIDKELKQFKTTKVDNELIHNRVIETALTNEIEFNFEDIELDINKKYKFKNMKEFLVDNNINFYEFKVDDESFSANYYFILNEYQGYDEKIFCYVNSSLLFEGGTAVNFFFNAFFNAVQEKLKREIKKRKLQINKNDIRQNMLVLANIKMKNPRYDNQSKTRLISQEIKKHIDKMVQAGINKFISENEQWVNDVLDRAEFRHKIAELEDVKKKQKKKKGKVAKLIDCYTKERSNASIVFSEGDCLNKNHKILTADGYKTLEDLELRDKILTHDGYKKILMKDFVTKKKCILKSNDLEIECSSTHKFPVYNIETKEVQVVTFDDIDINIHKLLKLKKG